MISVGQKLRQAREKQGYTIQQLAAQTKISLRYLQAIERDDPKSLPGLFFYKSFVQQYAGALGVSMDELRWELDRLVPPLEHTIDEPVGDPPPAAAQFLTGPEPVTSRLGFRVVILIVMLFACSAVYAIWDKMQRATAEQAGQLPQRRETPTSTAAPSGATSADAAKPALPAVTTPVADPPPVQTPVPPDKTSLVVTANDKTWFRVTADGKVVFAGTLEANESKNFDGFAKANLYVGNAGGLSVTYNGKPVGPIGPKGQVRMIVFTPENFEVQAPYTPDGDPDGPRLWRPVRPELSAPAVPQQPPAAQPGALTRNPAL